MREVVVRVGTGVFQAVWFAARSQELSRFGAYSPFLPRGVFSVRGAGDVRVKPHLVVRTTFLRSNMPTGVNSDFGMSRRNIFHLILGRWGWGLPSKGERQKS